MPTINGAAVLNPFTDLTANILDYVPRATTSEFGIVAIGSGINVDALGRIYLDTQEYSDRLTAIEAQAASSLTTQQTEVAAAIAQVNLVQSQTVTALTLEVSNLRTDLANSITATQTDLINRAEQLAQDVTDITVQLTQDKATFTQEIQDALDFLKDDASVASALRTPRKIQGVGFDGTQDISLPTFSTQTDGLVPKPEGSTTTKYLREDGTWVVPTDTTYTLLTKVSAEDGTATTANTISAQVLKEAIQYHAPTVTNIVGNAETATKLQTPRTINGVLFDGTQNISLPEAVAYSLPAASDSVLGGIKVGSGLAIANSVLSVGTLNQSTTGNAATATKLQTARSIAISGAVTGTATSFDGSSDITIATTAIDGSNISTGTIPAARIPTLNQSTTGNAGSATKLQTARLINGIAFDGTGDINLDVYSQAEVDNAIANVTPTIPDATTIDKGIVRLATESDITNSSETAVVTPKHVANMLVGIGALAKGFRALLSARLTQMTGTSTSSGKTITCTIAAHGLSVGDVVCVNYRYKDSKLVDQRATDTVAVTSVAGANTFTFISPQNAMGSASADACTLYYAIKNNYNVNSLAINSAGRYTISINGASGITGTNFIPFIQATTADNSLVIAQPEAITSATSLTVRTFNAAGTAIIPQWLHIGVTQ